jgi:hypothetical protein
MKCLTFKLSLTPSVSLSNNPIHGFQRRQTLPIFRDNMYIFMHNSIIDFSNPKHNAPRQFALMMMAGGPGVTAHAAALASSPSTTSTAMAAATTATMTGEGAELEGEPGRPARTQCLSNILPTIN